ncbi:transmembrane protein 87A [Onthophagus taurus]|uniref:transmembrane protein 87A n=1 Tax=Onthophagus taurus TaxID=166361 RepID=UPI0039BDFAE8
MIKMPRNNIEKCTLFMIIALNLIGLNDCLPDEGKWDCNLTKDHTDLLISKSLFNGTQIFIKLNCETTTQHPTNISISWVVIQSQCWDFNDYFTKDFGEFLNTKIPFNVSGAQRSLENIYKCDDHILLKEEILEKDEKSLFSKSHPFYKTRKDGLYVLGFRVNSVIQNNPSDDSNENDFTLGVHIEMLSPHGFLSAVDYPLLPFYAIMCGTYFVFGTIWLFWSFTQWKDLLRVQFWIGGVIFLGMLEKATFYAEYHSVNATGVRVQGAVLFAEWISCAKRTLARMLVIVVSLGFGIVKPRLGSTLHRVVGVGGLYFILAAYESYLRVIGPKNELRRDLLVASVPLAVLDSAICWWIFSALVATTRTLRLRRNQVKLTLYRHFTNTLIFAVLASVVFMMYSIKAHHMVGCLRSWKDLWIDEAYWHVLFSALLLVIMFLWRPTRNNQRYAFVPIFESGRNGDEEDDEEVEQLVNDAYGVKIRAQHHHGDNNLMKQAKNGTTQKSGVEDSVEDELKWLEGNVPATAITALPILDSDEELVNTRFEVSKMQ